MTTREEDVVEALRAALEDAKDAVSASYQQALAEQQGHDIRAGKFDDVVHKWRKTAEAALAAVDRHRASQDGAQWQPTHRHLKRGSEYQEMGRGKLQTDVPLADDAELVAYVGKDGDWWFRPPSEFDDGRFVASTSSLSSAPATPQHVCDYPICSVRGAGHPLACRCISPPAAAPGEEKGEA